MLLRGVLPAAVLALAGCGGGGKEAATTGELPPGCDVPRIEQVVGSYLDAITNGNRAKLRRLVGDDVRLFEVHDGRGAGERHTLVHSKKQALAYLESRIRQNERLRLVNLQVAPGGDANHVLVTFTITRLADDFRARGIPNRVATGDGVVDCVAGQLEGWTVQGP